MEINKIVYLSNGFEKTDTELRFTPEEKASIEEELKAFDDGRVRTFIFFLEALCSAPIAISQNLGGKLAENYDRRKTTEIRPGVTDAVKLLQDTLRLLRKIEKSEVTPFTPDSIDELYLAMKKNAGSFNHVAHFNAGRAIPHIQKILDAFKRGAESIPDNTKSRTNRKELATRIAKCFYENLGVRPTSTDPGPFCNLLIIIFEAIGIRLSDPKKLAREAIRGM